MNRYGQAARRAYNPDAVVAFFERRPKPPAWRDAVEGRVLRRWRSTTRGITEHALRAMLACYGCSVDAFRSFCRREGYAPVLRDRRGRQRHRAKENR